MKPVTSVEYVLIRDVIRFIAYRKNWSIVRTAEWLLARRFDQYISAYKQKANDDYCEINDVNDNDDIATQYILEQIVDIGDSAICTEGKTEESKYFYKAYYKLYVINDHHILNKLNLDFNQIHAFSYSTDTEGYVTAVKSSVIDDTKGATIYNNIEQQLLDAKLEIERLKQAQSTGSSMMGKAVIGHVKPKTNEELIQE